MPKTDKKRVLIVDDGQDVIDVLSFVLGKEGFLVSAARDGEEALERIREALPDVILLDIMMPKMDGATLYKKLQANPLAKDIPIIVMTGSGSWGKERLSPEDVSAYFEKPFSISDIVQTVKDVLNSRVR